MFFLIYFSNSIDATDASTERLVNDSRYYPKSVIRKCTVSGIRHLCIYATRDIDKDEETLYWFGEEGLDWHKEVWITFFTVTCSLF